MSPTLTEGPLPDMTLQLLSSRGVIFDLHLEFDLAHVVSGTLANVILAEEKTHEERSTVSFIDGSPVIVNRSFPYF